MLAAEPSIGGAAFLVVNADNLYPAAALAELAALDGPGLPAFSPANLVATSNISEDRIAAFALIDVDEHGMAAAHHREAGCGSRRRARGGGPRQHERMALRRADFPGLPRRCAIGAR